MGNTDYPFLVVKCITKTYTRDGVVYNALDNVSLTIKQGEIFSLLGVNGAGKTTLSSILATVHPPTSGDVVFNGMSIYQHLSMYRRHIGFCPQYQNLDMELTVRDNLVFATPYHDVIWWYQTTGTYCACPHA
jgi:ABC-2 type transport system ATP-binding protein